MRQLLLLIGFALAAIGAPPVAAQQTPRAPTSAASVRAGALALQNLDAVLVNVALDGTGLPAGRVLGRGRTPPRNESILRIAASRVGTASSTILRGWYSAALGIAAERTLDTIRVGDLTYVRGPVPTVRLAEQRWYLVDVARPAVQPPLVTDLSGLRLLEGVDIGRLRRAGDAAVAGLSCTAFAGSSRQLLTRRLLTPAGRPLPFAAALASARSSEMIFTVCSDGLLRQVSERILLAGTAPNTPVFETLLTFAPIASPVPLLAPDTTRPLLEATASSATALRETPSGSARILAPIGVGQTVSIVARSADRRWYQVMVRDLTGWVLIAALRVPPEVATAVPAEGTAPTPTTVGTPTAAP